MARVTFPIFDKLGGRDEAVSKIRALNERWNIDAARMWIVRRSLPGDAIRDLMAVAEAAGIPFGSSDFVAIETDVPAPGDERAA